MKKLLHELWHDLRAKRLWPVALLLVVALVAVPTVLKKGSKSPTPPAPTPVAAGAAANANKAVVVADTNTDQNSTLGVFNKKDPFKPDKAVLSAAHPKVVAPKGGSTASSGGGNSNAGSNAGSGSGSGSGGGSGSGSGGNTGGSSPQTTPQAPKGPFAYTVDVKFGKRGELRLHHNVQKLDILPNQNNPLLIFMGVNTAGDTAVFLTDTSLKAAGEGTCKPNGDTCSFLYLKLGDGKNTESLSEVATDGSGTEYTLVLKAIHKVPVSELAKNAKKAAKAARDEARRAHIGKGKPATRFSVPFGLKVTPDTGV
jgi:hypothetical protein